MQIHARRITWIAIPRDCSNPGTSDRAGEIINCDNIQSEPVCRRLNEEETRLFLPGQHPQVGLGDRVAAMLAAALTLRGAEQTSIPRVEAMPDLPVPFAMRDWRQVARNYLEFVFDSSRLGPDLPLLKWEDGNDSQFTLPSYVGGHSHSAEGINFLAAVVSGGLVGEDMRHFQGHNWVDLATNYFNPHLGVLGNGWGGEGGASYWYDLFPDILYFQICDLFPGGPQQEKILRSVAERLYAECLVLGAETNGPGLPNFDHTSFNFRNMRPVNNGVWIEPDGAAGVAWCEYMAWTRFKDPRFLTAADWCLRSLLQRPRQKSPLYEVLLPYGALTAARMNAELGRNYDVAKFLNWCFDPMNRPAARPSWGVLTARFGQDDCAGLVGSTTDTNGYAFVMNTSEWVGALAPLARYDSRYAGALGKWLLNLANAERLFYANALPASHQDHRAWADRNDPNYSLAYEGLRRHPRGTNAPQPYATGDAFGSEPGELNFCLYGSSHVGILGGMIGHTSIERILKIDLLRTDYFHIAAYPTFLFYNPFPTEKTFTADFGPGPFALYDAVANKMLTSNAAGMVPLTLKTHQAMIVVVATAGAKLSQQSNRVLLSDTVAAWCQGGRLDH